MHASHLHMTTLTIYENRAFEQQAQRFFMGPQLFSGIARFTFMFLLSARPPSSLHLPFRLPHSDRSRTAHVLQDFFRIMD